MSETQLLHVAANCPQCGGSIEFEEEASVIKCSYCGSALLLGNRQGVVRYIAENNVGPEDLERLIIRAVYKQTGRNVNRFSENKLIYAPFWRIRGYVFRWLLGRQKSSDHNLSWDNGAQPYAKELKTRWLDLSFRAFQEPNIGVYSLGIRTSVIRLRYFNLSPENQSTEFIRVNIPIKKAFLRSHRAMGAGLYPSKVKNPELDRMNLIGERASLIYLPLWVVNCAYPMGKATFIVDGLCGDVVKACWGDNEHLQFQSDERLDKYSGLAQVEFLPFRCPDCGWDLPFNSFYIVHVCQNCKRAWTESKGMLVEVDYSVVDPSDAIGRQWIFLPFWTFNGVIQHGDHRLENMAHLHRLVPPPRVVDFEAESKKPIRFFIPAFKSRNLSHLNNIAYALLLKSPKLKYIPRYTIDGKDKLTGVFLPESEARQMARMVLFSLIPAGNRRAQRVLGKGKLELNRPRLEWFPFAVSKHNYTEALSGFALTRNAVDVL